MARVKDAMHLDLGRAECGNDKSDPIQSGARIELEIDRALLAVAFQR